MVKSKNWRRLALVLSAMMMLAITGCQSDQSPQEDLILTQAPPAVRAEFIQRHQGTTIKRLTRGSHGGQDYYTFTLTGPDGKDRTIVMNEAGDEIDNH
jgi:hypothetical protein